MCATRRLNLITKTTLPMQSLVCIAHDVLKMEFCNSWQDREMRTGKKKKKKEKESGKCRPPGTKKQFIQPAC